MTEQQTISFTAVHLPAVEAILQSLGVLIERQAFHVRCKLPSTDAPVYIVSSENVFSPERTRDEIENAIWELKEVVLTDKTDGLPHLFIAGDAASFKYPGHRAQREHLELDCYSPIKRIVGLDELAGWFTPLFPIHAETDAASPQLTILRYLQYGAPVLSSATHVFNKEDELERYYDALHGGFSPAEQILINSVYRRIMGSVHQLHWTDEGPCLGRVDQGTGMPYEFASAGEQTALAFASFLVRLQGQASPQMRLGLHNFFNGIDSIRRFNALGCVGEFIKASRASVLVQSEKEETRNLAKIALRPYITSLGMTVVEKESESTD